MGKKRWYFPSKDADVIPWAGNFVSVLNANAARWGIAADLVTNLGALCTAYEEAYTRRFLPDTGKVSVEQKDLALATLKKGVQTMVNGHINHNPAVTPDDRVALGLHVYDSGRGPIPAPATTVVLRPVPGLVRQIVVPFTDFREEDRGKTVYMAGHWKGHRQQDGPWSAIIPAIIP